MHKQNFVLPTATLLLLFAFTQEAASVFAQGFDNYVKPQTGAEPAIVQNQVAAPVQQANVQNIQPNLTAPSASTSGAAQGGYLANREAVSAIVDPPAEYRPTQEELALLDEFLARWESYGKNIKRVSCDVHMREFDAVLQKDSQRPVAHTWGQFRFITPNKLSYHVKGEFEYSDAKPDGEWKESQNEWQVVLDGKAFTQYDYQNKKAIVFPIPEDEQDIDLTMDNGQFPLFFVAKAETLKSRFYLRIVTPESKLKKEVWIEAFPKYTRDAQQFRSILVLLRLKDLQPTYMRRTGANGKSRTDISFEGISINKGVWSIEGNVDRGWTKEVRDEKFSILNQRTIVTENGVVATLVEDPKDFPSSRNQARPVNAGTASSQRRPVSSAQMGNAPRRQ